MNNKTNNFKSVSKSSNRSTPMFQAETPKEEAKRKCINAIKRDAGKYVDFSDEGIIGLLAGACVYNGWANFLIIDKDKKIIPIKAINTYHIVKNIPANLSVLDYLKRDQPEFLQEITEDFIKNDKLVSEQLGKISISYEFEKRNNSNAHNRNNKNKTKNKKNNKK